MNNKIHIVMNKNFFVNFVIKTDEAIRLECRRGKDLANREIFIVKEKYFFYYVLNRRQGVNTVSLREITAEEYLARKKELLSCRPDENTKEWENDGNSYALKTFYYGTWRRNMSAKDCIFLTEENPVKEIVDSVVAQISQMREKEISLDKEAKREYGRKCGGLAQKLGISFVNALRIGPEKGKLMKFKESYQRALITAQALSLHNQRRLYDQLNGGRKTRKEGIEMLGIQFFDADVNLMDFTELEKNLWSTLHDYSEESVKRAIRNGAEMDYQTRLALYNKLDHNSREVRREALTTLGVDLELIEFKRYPTQRIKKALAATLGIELN
ncbi:MAG: hypothetical protein NC218_06405 [Acetobacter sp.]|nr:hypothetical protein [Acetobacter sp.]